LDTFYYKTGQMFDLQVNDEIIFMQNETLVADQVNVEKLYTLES